MSDPLVKEIFILGLTQSGRIFRPSDWAERLAGVMSPFRPGGAQNRFHPASYSPWCLPTTLNGTKCVVVHTDLRNAEPMAYDFVMNFARDNDLQTVQACLLPTETGSGPEIRDSKTAPTQSQTQAQISADWQLQAS
jgi:hypothetical protein